MTEILRESGEALTPFNFTLAAEKVEHSGMRSLLNEAAQAFGVDLEEQEKDDWLTMSRAVYVIDQYLDEEKVDIMPQIAAMLSGNSIADIPEQFQVKCRQFMERQSEMRRMDIIAKLGQVTTLVSQQAAAESVQELITIRHQEADLFANLLALPIYGRSDEPQRKSFNNWLTAFSRSGYIFDSLKDLKADYLDGSSGVRPTIYSRGVLAGTTFKDTYSAIRETPREVLKKCALVAIRHQLLGKQPNFISPVRTI